LGEINFFRNRNSFLDYKSILSRLLTDSNTKVSDAKLTICITTYKRPQLLQEAIRSALDQKTNLSFRIIVLDNDDDFSNMENLRMVNELSNNRIDYYKNEANLGMIGNWNRCAELVETEYFSLLHDDDLLKENYVNEVLGIISKYPAIDGLCIETDSISSPTWEKGLLKNSKIENLKFQLRRISKRVLPRIIKFPLHANILLGNIYGPPTCGMLFKRESFLESGGFDPRFFPSADWLFMIFFDYHYNVLKYKNTLGTYRWIENESLNFNTIEKFRDDRKKCITAMKENFSISRITAILFWPILMDLIDSDYGGTFRRHYIFKVIQRIYVIFLRY